MKKNAWLSLALGFVLVACGGDESSDDTSGNPGDEPGDAEDYAQTAGYVFDSLLVPTDNETSQAYGLDIDGNGTIDNGLGKVISTILSFASDQDLQAKLDESVAKGSVILVAELGYESFEASESLMHLYQGENPSTEPCAGDACGKHLDGETGFEISAASPRDNKVPGTISSGTFRGAHGKVSIPLPLGETITTVNVIEAAAVADVTAADMYEGKLGGGITKDEIDNKILPAVAEILAEQTADECMGAAPNCCEAGSNGETIMNIFDENGDCTVSVTELQNNSLLQSILAPDLDLLDASGNLGTDGEKDSLSLGIGFSAVGARIAK